MDANGKEHIIPRFARITVNNTTKYTVFIIQGGADIPLGDVQFNGSGGTNVVMTVI